MKRGSARRSGVKDLPKDVRDQIDNNVKMLHHRGGHTTFREMAAESNHWAILDRQAVFHLGSKYSVLLFQHIASLQNLKHVTSKRFTVPDLRAMFGMSDGKFSRSLREGRSMRTASVCMSVIRRK